MEEVLRGTRRLAVLGALAALAYVAYRARARLQERIPRVGSTFPAAHFEPAPFASEAPAGPVAMVAPMDNATSAAPVAVRVDSNGSPQPVRDASSPATRVSDLGPIELPPKRKLSGPVLAALAALVGVAAIALATTAVAASLDSDDGGAEAIEQTTTDSVPAAQQALSLLSKPSTQRLPIANSGGRVILAVGVTGRGVLVLDGLGLAPAGKAYQAWVIKPKAKAAPASAAVFSGIETIVPLSVAVKPGSVVAITIERAGGVKAPTQTPKLVAQPAT